MSRVALYNFFNPDGVVTKHTIYQLKEIRSVSDYLIVIANGNLKEPESLDPFVDRIILRDNTGMDYGAYAYAFENEYSLIQKYDELLLFNCSFFGPFISLQEIVQKMERSDCDFWGLSSSEKHWNMHVQSFFMLFRKSICSTDVLKDFFVMNEDDRALTYKDVVVKFEATLTEYLVLKGYQFDAVCRNLSCDIYTNPFGSLTIDEQCFLKKKALDINNCDHAQIEQALSIVHNKYPCFDLQLIYDEMPELRRITDSMEQRRCLPKCDYADDIRWLSYGSLLTFVLGKKHIILAGLEDQVSHIQSSIFMPTGIRERLLDVITYAQFTDDVMTSISNRINNDTGIVFCDESLLLDEKQKINERFNDCVYLFHNELDPEPIAVNISDSIITAMGLYYYYGGRTLAVVDSDGYYCGVVGEAELNQCKCFTHDTLIGMVVRNDEIAIDISDDLFEQLLQSDDRNCIPVVDQRRFVKMIYK